MSNLSDQRKRETLRLGAELESRLPEIARLGLGHLLALGSYDHLSMSAFQATSPVLGDALDVELAANWPAAAGRGVFVAAAAAAGMVEEQGDGRFWFPGYHEALPSWGRKREAAKAKREALGKTISDIRSEAGKKGGEALASKRKANRSHLASPGKQTAGLPSFPPSVPPSNEPTEPPQEEPAGAGAAPTARKVPSTGIAGWYTDAWTERYGRAPSPQKHDLINAAKALKPFPAEEQEEIIRAFVADEDPWLCGKVHSLAFLPKEVDRIRVTIAGTLSTGRPRARSITQPSFQNEGLAGSAKYRNTPVRLVGPTPPSFRAEDEPLEGSKLDGIPVAILGDAPEPEDESFRRLAREFPKVEDRGAAAAAWSKLEEERRAAALTALPGVLRVWRAATPDERRFVPELGPWLGSRFLADPEELEIEVFGNRRFVALGPVHHADAAVPTEEAGRVVGYGFDSFWATYPKKVGKADAEKAWRKLSPGEREKAGSVVSLYADAMADRPQFVKEPAGWLDGKRFEDDPAAWQPRATGRTARPPSETGFAPPSEVGNYYANTPIVKGL